MIGQIRSYISYITVDSEETYINRIRNMIDNLDSTNKEILTKELNNKLNEISIMKQYQKPKEEVVEPVYYQPEEVFTKAKSFEEEINDLVNQYLQNQDDTSGGRISSIETTKLEDIVSEKNDKLPSIYTSAYNLIKIYTGNPVLLRKISTTNKRNKVMVKTNGINMPTLPIYDE